MDLSQMSDADLDAAIGSKRSETVSNAPQTAQTVQKAPSAMSDAELDAAIQSHQKNASNTTPTGNDQPSGNTTLASIANSPTVSKVLAVGGAMAKDIGSVASMANKLGSGVAQRLGLIDQQTKAAYDAHIDQKFAPPAVSTEAMASHPNYAMAGDIAAKAIPATGVGMAAGAGAAAMGASKLASWIPSAVSSVGTNASLGAALSPENRTAGAIGGAVGGAALGGVGALVGKLAESSAPAIKVGLKNLSDKAMGALADPTADAQTNAVNAVVSHFRNAKAVVDAAEEKFRGIPGTFDATGLKGTVDKTLAGFKDEMTPSQTAILQRVSSTLEQPQTAGNLVDIKRALNNNYNVFHNPMNVSSDELGKAFNGVLDSAKNQIGDTLQKSGNDNLYKTYTDVYNSSLKPLQDLKINKWANLDPDSDAFAVKSQSFFKKMVNTNNPGEIQALRNALGPTANTAVTSHFMSAAVDSATDAEGNLKVGSLINKLDKLKDAGAVPKGTSEADMMDGIRKIALTSQNLNLLHKVPVVGNITGGIKDVGSSVLYHAGKLLNALPNSAMGQAALRKIGTSVNPDLVTRALESSAQLAGAKEGAYQATQVMGPSNPQSQSTAPGILGSSPSPRSP